MSHWKFGFPTSLTTLLNYFLYYRRKHPGNLICLSVFVSKVLGPTLRHCSIKLLIKITQIYCDMKVEPFNDFSDLLLLFYIILNVTLIIWLIWTQTDLRLIWTQTDLRLSWTQTDLRLSWTQTDIRLSWTQTNLRLSWTHTDLRLSWTHTDLRHVLFFQTLAFTYMVSMISTYV